MISAKFTIKTKPDSKGLHSIVLVIIKNRKNTSLSIRQYCKKEDWSTETNRVKNSCKNHKVINQFLEKYLNKTQSLIDEKRLMGEDYEIKDLVMDILTVEGEKISIDYFSFHQEIIDEFIESKKSSSAKINKETLKSLQTFSNLTALKFKDLNVEFLEKYESFLRGRGGTDSGIGIKMRTIRAILNKAIDRKIMPDKYYPFKTYKIAKLKNENKREYLTRNEILLLEELDVSHSNRLQFAKDLYLFSFYCRGLNFIDIMQLTKYNLHDNTLTYTRSKTGVHLSFDLVDFAKKTLAKYILESKTIYLFPILLDINLTDEQIKNREHKVLGRVNPDLKKIMEKLKINKNITFYTARHSFATLMKFKGHSIDFIGEALGHSDINSTISYLNKLPSQKLDQIVNDIF